VGKRTITWKLVIALLLVWVSHSLAYGSERRVIYLMPDTTVYHWQTPPSEYSEISAKIPVYSITGDTLVGYAGEYPYSPQTPSLSDLTGCPELLGGDFAPFITPLSFAEGLAAKGLTTTNPNPPE
jgi:hypothetical protein